MEWYRFIVHGRVQGVFYRKSVSQALMRKQIKGYVQNLPDSRVEVVAELFEDDFDSVMRILKEGSLLSSINEVTYESIHDASFNADGFEIRY